MTKEYLKKPNTLIAMCCPFDDDLENQEIREIAKTLDPDGRRTVGILTKADRLPEGQEATWMKILQNQPERYQLLHGYFAVKNPGQPELDEGLSNEEARKKEKQFFRGESWQKAKDRCGTKQLRECLCQLLHDLVNQQLEAEIVFFAHVLSYRRKCYAYHTFFDCASSSVIFFYAAVQGMKNQVFDSTTPCSLAVSSHHV